jgi:hypothetical protein
MLLAPLLVVAAICMAHANWLHVTLSAAGPALPLEGFSLHEGCSCYLDMGSCSLGSFFREHVPFGYLALLLCLLWFVQGSLFPLLVYVLFCWFLACIASLSCYFLSIQFLHLIKKKKN